MAGQCNEYRGVTAHLRRGPRRTGQVDRHGMARTDHAGLARHARRVPAEDVHVTVSYRMEVVDALALREAGFRAIRDDARLAEVFAGKEDSTTNALGILLRTPPDLPGVRVKGHSVTVHRADPGDVPTLG